MNDLGALLVVYLIGYAVGLLGLCGIVYAVTVTIRLAWHPQGR